MVMCSKTTGKVMLDCSTIMQPIKTFLYQDDPAQIAIDFMMDQHRGLIPVVDGGERFVGLLSSNLLMHAMLPKHLTMVRGIKCMNYLRESEDELRERLKEIGKRTIGEIMDTQAKVVYPDSPLVEAHQILSGTQLVVPVVDKETNKLLGAISFFTLFSKLRKETQRNEPAEQNPEQTKGID